MVQVDPIKPKKKLPGTKPFKLNCDEPFSNFAFKFSLRRYIGGLDAVWAGIGGASAFGSPVGRCMSKLVDTQAESAWFPLLKL